MSVTKDEERATLEAMLEEARSVVLRLENALGCLDRGDVADHPVVYWRKRRGLNQAALARLVGISPAALCRIENSPGLAARNDTRSKLAQALGVPLEWLLLTPGESPQDGLSKAG